MALNHVKEYNQKIRAWLLKVFALAKTIQPKDLIERTCPVCNSRERTFYANNDFLNYHQCNSCRLIYMNPSPSPDNVDRGFLGEDELLMEYFSIIRQYKSKVLIKTDPLNDSKLLDIYKFKQSGKLLDVGCSIGDFLHRAKYYFDVEGLEINPHTSAIAEESFKVHKDFLHKLHLEPVYDIVSLNQILYGVTNPVGLLKDINNVLKDDGILYINSPNADSYAMELYGGKTNHLYGYTTQNVFNKQSLEELANRSGFRVVSFRTEWLDIYVTDLAEFYDHPDLFIHKRNCHIYEYEEKIRKEDLLHESLNIDLGNRGNYLVAVLAKTTQILS